MLLFHPDDFFATNKQLRLWELMDKFHQSNAVGEAVEIVLKRLSIARGKVTL